MGARVGVGVLYRPVVAASSGESCSLGTEDGRVDAGSGYGRGALRGALVEDVGFVWNGRRPRDVAVPFIATRIADGGFENFGGAAAVGAPKDGGVWDAGVGSAIAGGPRLAGGELPGSGASHIRGGCCKPTAFTGGRCCAAGGADTSSAARDTSGTEHFGRIRIFNSSIAPVGSSR